MCIRDSFLTAGDGRVGHDPSSDPLDLNLRDRIEIGVPAENNKSVPDRSCGDPGIHDVRPPPCQPRFGDDGGKYASDLGVDRNGVEILLHPAQRSKPPGSDPVASRSKHPEVQLRERDDGNCRLIGQAADRASRLEGNENRRV